MNRSGERSKPTKSQMCSDLPGVSLRGWGSTGWLHIDRANTQQPKPECEPPFAPPCAANTNPLQKPNKLAERPPPRAHCRLDRPNVLNKMAIHQVSRQFTTDRRMYTTQRATFLSKRARHLGLAVLAAAAVPAAWAQTAHPNGDLQAIDSTIVRPSGVAVDAAGNV